MSDSALPPHLLAVPIVGAPLAGGPTTPALAAAVCEAGGLGFLAAGYLTAAAFAADIDAVRGLTSRPFGANIFYPTREDVDPAELAAYAERLAPEASRHGVAVGDPRWTDDDWEAKLEVVRRERPAVVSFTFGCPDRDIVEELSAAGSSVWCTVTSPAEAEEADSAGVDALVVQGGEAGGHQGSFRDHSTDPFPLLTQVQRLDRNSFPRK